MLNTTNQTSIDWGSVDLAHQKVKLAADIVAWPVWENGERIYRLEHTSTHRFFRVGEREYLLLSLLDGRVTVAAACGIVASRLGHEAISQQESESLVVWALEEQIATIVGRPCLISDQFSSAGNAEPRQSWISRANPFWMQIPVLRSSAKIDSLLSIAQHCFAPVVAGTMLILIAIAVVAYWFNRSAVNESASDLFSREGWIYLLATWLALKVVHELGHAAACKRMGGQPGEMGIVLILFAPLAYVDVTSCWRMPLAWSRILVSAAGMYLEISIAAIAMIGWLYFDSPMPRFWFANIVLTAGLSTLLFNANPLMRFDGYYILSDAVQIPNLYNESSTELKRVVSRLVYGKQSKSGHYRGFRQAFVLSYGIAALFWRLTICVALCATASVMFSGAGVVLAAMGVLSWFGKPIWKYVVSTVNDFQHDRPRFMRFAVSGVILTTASVYCLFTPVPSSVKLHGVVLDPPNAVVRSVAEGFVERIHVANGARVAAGAPLITLTNDELSNHLKRLELELAEAQIQLKISVNSHDASGEWIARRELESAAKKIQTLRPKVAGLVITAKEPGVVSIENPKLLNGKFVREGDELLRVLNSNPKEIVAAVQQDHISLAKSMLHQKVNISDVRNELHTGTVKSISPRATRKLPDLSLAAHYGGPLAVIESDASDEQNSDEATTRMTEPHFVIHAEVPFESSTQLATGTRIRLHLGYHFESLWQRCETAFRRLLLRRKNEANPA